MKNLLLDSSYAVADSDLNVPDSVEPVAHDRRQPRSNDDSKYRAWEFDPADAAMVDELSY